MRDLPANVARLRWPAEILRLPAPATPERQARAILSTQAHGSLIAFARRTLDPTAPQPFARPRNHTEEIDAARADELDRVRP